MTVTDLKTPASSLNEPDHDYVIVGAGICGIYQLHKLAERGADVVLLEAGADVGGTWFWNRYPGARFDSESYTYAYSFSKELLDEWDWSELFASQPETLRYLNHVVDKFDLRPHMRFGQRVSGAVWDEANRWWTVTTGDGSTVTTRLLLTAVGVLSAPTLPRYEGLDTFEGESFHTYDWPVDAPDLRGKRVGVIGTGSTGVQLICTLAPVVGELAVFQRRPNWCAPLRNRPISPEEMEEIRSRYDEVFERCRQTPGGFLHGPDRRRSSEVSDEERLAFWEDLYAAPGFGVWLGNFRDVLADADANAEYSAFIADKIRKRLDDPELAEKLIPKDHGFGTRRPPLESGYYEAYNQPNVRLVDLSETPVVRIVPEGIETTAGIEHLDVIIYATGFDAVTGPYDRMDIVGVDGATMREKWADGPKTFVGVQVSGFPNLMTLSAPQGASVSTNFPRGIEEFVDWTTDLLDYMAEHGYTRIEATTASERAWGDHVDEMAAKVLLTNVRSWFTGYNTNIDREYKPRNLVYVGGNVRLRKRLGDIKSSGYAGFDFS